MPQPPVTEAQAREVVEAVERCGVKEHAARSLNMPVSTLRNRLNAAWRLYGLMPHVPRQPVAEGYALGKATIQTNASGVVQNVWSRTNPDAAAIEAFVESLEGRAKTAAPKRIKPASKVPKASLGEIVIGDPHAGMYAWAAETGDDYDLEIFERLHTEGPAMLLDRMGDRETIIMAYMGDLFHADNHQTTERSGNILDVDGRIDKVMDVTIRAVCAAVEDAAKRCKRLQVVCIPGNHDRLSSKWMNRVLTAYYHRSKHIEIVSTPRNRTYLEHGNTLLGYHHGDRIQATKLQACMSQEQKEAWGRTTHRYWRCGHDHQSKRYRPHWDCEEAPGCMVEYFPVLAGLEAYGAEAGYHSRRAMIGIEHHMQHGEVGRHVVTPQMIRG